MIRFLIVIFAISTLQMWSFFHYCYMKILLLFPSPLNFDRMKFSTMRWFLIQISICSMASANISTMRFSLFVHPTFSCSVLLELFAIIVMYFMKRIFGLFPYVLNLKAKSVRICQCSAALSYGYLIAISVNIVYFIVYFEDVCQQHHYFFIARQFLTHATLLVYMITIILRIQSFKNCIDCLLTVSFAHPISNSNFKQLYAFFIINCMWIALSVLYCIVYRDCSIFVHFLFFEDVIIVFMETEICVILLLVYIALRRLGERTKWVVQLHQSRSRKNHCSDVYTVQTTVECSFEDVRLLHLRIFQAVSTANDCFGIFNLVFILAARFTFAFYLYSALSRSFRFVDFAISCFSFQRIFFICFCFQMIKNQEENLKVCVNGAKADFLDEKSLLQFELFNNQIHILELKFDAYGLFSMDFTTVLSILTTTAGYLVILSQMNV